MRARIIGVVALTATLLTALPMLPASTEATPVTVVTSSFEGGTTQGWAPRGAETVAASETVAHGGIGSLAVTARTATWQGPVLDVLPIFEQGTQYTISVWVRLATGAAADSARISVERRSAGVAAYDAQVGRDRLTGAWSIPPR